jgi:hypothetical protein
MGSRMLTKKDYTDIVTKTVKHGSTTFAGTARHQKGEGLHELVDPAGFGAIRRSLSRKNPIDDQFVLSCGTAMLEETRLDTTGSMGNNVSIAMKVLPQTYDLLATVENAVLKRYDVQMITAIFGDVCDNYILCRSQAEMDEKIAEQMTYMVPEGNGGDTTEDPQYGLFGAAYLTDKVISKYYGLKSYDFTITDAPGRSFVTLQNLKRVFGDNVLDKVKENGQEIDKDNLPSTKQIVDDLLKTTHAFLLGVGLDDHTKRDWEAIYGPERVIDLPRTELLPEIKAAIIGLTEGVLTLQSLEKFLIEEAKLSKEDAAKIKRCVAGIPIGAQTLSPNFDKIPLRGAIFAKKEDLWPITETTDSSKESMWK